MSYPNLYQRVITLHTLKVVTKDIFVAKNILFFMLLFLFDRLWENKAKNKRVRNEDN